MQAPPPLPTAPAMTAPPPLPSPGVSALAALQAPPLPGAPPLPVAAMTAPPALPTDVPPLPPVQPAPPTQPALDANALIARYIALRDQKEDVQARHKEELAPINEEMTSIEGHLLSALTAMNINSVTATGLGTALKATESSASIADAETFQRFVIDNKRWDMIDWKANKAAARQYIVDNKAPPPGVNFRSEIVVQVRRASGTGGKSRKGKNGAENGADEAQGAVSPT
jgi:hypothetical protein